MSKRNKSNTQLSIKSLICLCNFLILWSSSRSVVLSRLRSWSAGCRYSCDRMVKMPKSAIWIVLSVKGSLKASVGYRTTYP